MKLNTTKTFSQECKCRFYLYQSHNCIIFQGSDVRRSNILSSSPGNVSPGNQNITTSIKPVHYSNYSDIDKIGNNFSIRRNVVCGSWSIRTTQRCPFPGQLLRRGIRYVKASLKLRFINLSKKKFLKKRKIDYVKNICFRLKIILQSCTHTTN